MNRSGVASRSPPSCRRLCGLADDGYCGVVGQGERGYLRDGAFTGIVRIAGMNGGDSDGPVTTVNPVAKADCVPGTSTIGDCKI